MTSTTAPFAMTDEDRTILGDLLVSLPIDGGAVPFAAFRARHHKQLGRINQLVSDGLIHDEQGTYTVGLIVLDQLDIAQAKSIIDVAGRLFDALRSHYLAFQGAPLDLTDLARQSKATMSEVTTALCFMRQNSSWFGGSSSGSSPDSEAYVCASEGILNVESFRDLIAQLRTWRTQSAMYRAPSSVPPLPGDQEVAKYIASKRPRPPWFDQLEGTPKQVLTEVYVAIDAELFALPVMGARTIIDMICVDKVGDSKNFTQKLDELVSLALLSNAERRVLGAAIEMGNATVHRGHFPDAQDLNDVMDICERLAFGHYVMESAATRLESRTPPRHRPVPKK